MITPEVAVMLSAVRADALVMLSFTELQLYFLILVILRSGSLCCPNPEQ
jgi:hypothetical protein